MREQIVQHLAEPAALERLYREHPAAFKQAFVLLFPTIAHDPVAQVWSARFEAESETTLPTSRNEWGLLLGGVFVAGFIAKLPAFTGWAEEFFYPRNIAFVVFPLLVAFFAWKNGLSRRVMAGLAAVVGLSALYMNLLPGTEAQDTFVLACLHLPLFLWSVTGAAFVGPHWGSDARRLAFLRYNGDLVVMTAVLVLAGGLMSALTMGLFSLIDLNIETWYMPWVGAWGLAAAPFVATWLVRANPHLVGRVSPIIARVFTPLVLAVLVVYLVAVVASGKSPYTDREFLLVFNAVLLGVMALILFSLSEVTRTGGGKATFGMLLALAGVSLVLNGIALSAIAFRIAEWGLTPNRMAVLGSNLLLLGHLATVGWGLVRTVQGKADLADVEHRMAVYLPAYAVWTMIVAFLFPVLFGFR